MGQVDFFQREVERGGWFEYRQLYLASLAGGDGGEGDITQAEGVDTVD
jgi:hypothetical protein